jgi:uncharacterized membrane protein YraQ (UPF0718 family)
VDDVLSAVGRALEMAGTMGWEILWALILGFCLSAAVEAVVRKETIVRVMGDDSPRSLAVATGLGAASSSCSYAAVALARSLFRKGADFTAAMAFEIASTNLVIEMGIILALLMGWQFTLAEFVGGPLMILFLAVLFRLFLRSRILRAAREQADRGLAGKMEGHAGMDMSVDAEGGVLRRLASRDGFTSTSHYFVMNWASVYVDIVVGLLMAGAFAAWVPESWLRGFFLADQPLAAKIWGPLVGPLLAVISFVCSIGNIPLAAVLWNGGISFGGVVSFVFADLIVVPVLLIYRKYYGTRMALFLFATFYAAMAGAGYVIELVFAPLGLVPSDRNAQVLEAHISWNYTTWLNIAFLVLAAALAVRFVRTGGVPMLRMMGGSPEAAAEHTHGHDGDTRHRNYADHGRHAGHGSPEADQAPYGTHGHDHHAGHEGSGGHQH